MTVPILIGTRGYEHPAWDGEFYPAELPPDWRFCFYSNRLRSVLIPGEMWPRVDAETVRQWMEDGDPQFRFVLEVPASVIATQDAELTHAKLDEWLTLVAPLGARIAGFFIRGDTDELAEQGRLLAELRSRAPVCLGSKTCAPPSGLIGKAGDLWVALVSQADPRLLRDVLDALAAWSHGGAQAALFVDDSVMAHRLAEQARVLAELMGI